LIFDPHRVKISKQGGEEMYKNKEEIIPVTGRKFKEK
jgi:hypothetical protein